MSSPGTPIGRTEIKDWGNIRIVRQWHPNGSLVEEERCKTLPDGRFILHGTSRRWNSEGELIGSFDVTDGTGVQLVWYDNGQLAAENPMLDGLLTGLQRGWDESGYLMFERFWYRGAPVSKKRYRDLQESDRTIARYDEAEFRTITQKRKDAAS